MKVCKLVCRMYHNGGVLSDRVSAHLELFRGIKERNIVIHRPIALHVLDHWNTYTGTADHMIIKHIFATEFLYLT